MEILFFLFEYGVSYIFISLFLAVLLKSVQLTSVGQGENTFHGGLLKKPGASLPGGRWF